MRSKPCPPGCPCASDAAVEPPAGFLVGDAGAGDIDIDEFNGRVAVEQPLLRDDPATDRDASAASTEEDDRWCRWSSERRECWGLWWWSGIFPGFSSALAAAAAAAAAGPPELRACDAGYDAVAFMEGIFARAAAVASAASGVNRGGRGGGGGGVGDGGEAASAAAAAAAATAGSRGVLANGSTAAPKSMPLLLLLLPRATRLGADAGMADAAAVQ